MDYSGKIILFLKFYDESFFEDFELELYFFMEVF